MTIKFNNIYGKIINDLKKLWDDSIKILLQVGSKLYLNTTEVNFIYI